MPLLAATWALAAALGATGDLDLRLRAEVRGLEGGPTGVVLFEPAPYQLEATVALTGQLTPSLGYALSAVPRLLLLASPDVGHAVRQTAGYVSSSATLTWRADERLSFMVAGTGARGTLAMSPLNQLGPAAPSGVAPSGPESTGPAPAGAGVLDPAAGFRAAEFASGGVRATFDWRALPTLVIGGAIEESSGGGVSAADRLVYPAAGTFYLVGTAALALTPLDGIGLQANYGLTSLVGQEPVGILGGLLKWTRLLAPGLNGSAGVGVAATIQQAAGASSTALGGGLAPNLEASLVQAAPVATTGVGFGVLLGYAPYVDQFANQVRQRLSASANVDVVLGAHHRISWAVSSASAVSAVSGFAQGVAATQLGGWYRQDDLEVGLTLGAGIQESQGSGTAIRQWSVGVAGHWGRGPTL